MHRLGARVISYRNILPRVSASVSFLMLHASPGGAACFEGMSIFYIKTARETNVPVRVPFDDVEYIGAALCWALYCANGATPLPRPPPMRGRPPWPPCPMKFENGVCPWHPMFACLPGPGPPRLPPTPSPAGWNVPKFGMLNCCMGGGDDVDG